MNEEQQEYKVPDFEGEEMKMPENSSPQSTDEHQSKIIGGPILLLLTVLLILVLGGMYYWFSSLSIQEPILLPEPAQRPSLEENNEPESTTAEAQTETIQTLSTSDELDTIIADLEATDLENIDTELQAIDAEIDAAIIE